MTSREKEAMKLSNQMCFPLYAAARKVTGLYTPYLKPLGLTYTQYIALLVLWEKEAVTVGELCEQLMLDNGTVSPLLKKLEQMGYVTRSRSSEDERIVQVVLTDEGRNLQEQAKDIPHQVGSCLHLQEEKAVSLYQILYDILGQQNMV